MGFIRKAIVGIAIYEGIKYLAKRDTLGASNFDKIKEQVLDFVEKGEAAASDIESGVTLKH